MATDLTRLRYRADTPEAYATALLRLIQHARTSTDDFGFGPLKLADCERDGLAVTGPDLTPVTGILAAITGLAPVEA